MNKEILIAGKRIFYRLIGSGKPVILIHGFGEDGEVWKNQSPLPDLPPVGEGNANTQSSLNADTEKNNITPKSEVREWHSSAFGGSRMEAFKFIIPDLPGSGKSEMIDDMSMEGMAEVIKSIVDTECPKASPFGGGLVGVGHSMGGYIALAFAEKYPEYLNAFALFHSTAYADSEEKKVARRKGIEFINEHGAFEFLKTTIPNLFAPNSKYQIPNSIEELVAKGNNFSPAALVSYYQAMMQRPDRTEILRKTGIPVLFIMGEYDTAIPLEDGLKQCYLPGKSYIHILHHSGHMGMLEETDASNRVLENFLSEI